MKIMTFNIWNYTQPWPARRKVIAGLIRTWNPDVVGLQETRHDWRFERGRGQGEQLAEVTGYHATSLVAQVYMPLLRVDEGLTLLSRHPPLDVFNRRLTRLPRERKDENQRVCLGARFALDDVEVDVYTTHCSLSRVARVRNALEVARFVRETSGDRTAFLVGDLNAQPGELPVRFLTGQEPVAGERMDFLDLWVAAHPRIPGFTSSAQHPTQRIDYVMMRNGEVEALEVRLVGEDPVEGIFASDHRGVLADVRLKMG